MGMDPVSKLFFNLSPVQKTPLLYGVKFATGELFMSAMRFTVGALSFRLFCLCLATLFSLKEILKLNSTLSFFLDKRTNRPLREALPMRIAVDRRRRNANQRPEILVG